MSQIKAVIFDYDGTLMDTASVILDAYDHLSDHFGRPRPDHGQVRELLRHAVPMPQIMETLYPGIPFADLIRQNADYFGKNLSRVALFENVISLLQALKGRGIKLAIVTGGDKNVLDVMKQRGIIDFFDSVVHCDRVAFGKPNPEGLLLACKECDVLPVETIMVGDSPNDILAGKNAKAAVNVGITHGHGSRADLMAADADYIVDSIADLDDLLRRLT
jgi:phosphoglycolate phosphatase